MRTQDGVAEACRTMPHLSNINEDPQLSVRGVAVVVVDQSPVF